MPRRRTGINRAAAFPLPLPSGGSPVNRLSSHCPVPRPCRQAMLLLFLLAGLPVATVAQKPATPPAVTPAAPSPAPVTPPALTAPVLTQKQMLDGDTRLDRPVTLDVISVPLGEVLQKESLDKSTDKMEDANRFLLTAAPTCADLKLQIRLNKRPLRTLMQALAQMLPGTWTRTRHGYQLAMTKEAVSERAEWWRLFLGEREKALTLQRQAVLAAMQTKGDRRKDSDPDPEQSDRAVETDMADQHDFFQALPPALKEQIAANMDGSGFYEVERMGFGGDMEPAGTIGWLSQMSPQTQETFKAALQDNVNRLAQAPPAYQKYAARAQQDMAALDPSKVYFLFQNGGFVVYATPFNCPMSVSRILDLNVPTTTNTPPLRLDQTELADVVYGGAEMSPQWKRMADAVRKMGDAAPPERKLLAYRVYGMGEAAPDEWKRLAAYQRSRVWSNLLPKLPTEDHSTWPLLISRAAQTDWLGEKGHMEYVCDYYSHGGYAGESKEARGQAPAGGGARRNGGAAGCELDEGRGRHHPGPQQPLVSRRRPGSAPTPITALVRGAAPDAPGAGRPPTGGGSGDTGSSPDTPASGAAVAGGAHGSDEAELGLGGGGVQHADALADPQRPVAVPAGGKRPRPAERRHGGEAV